MQEISQKYDNFRFNMLCSVLWEGGEVGWSVKKMGIKEGKV
jgi:hypothetical protein